MCRACGAWAAPSHPAVPPDGSGAVSFLCAAVFPCAASARFAAGRLPMRAGY
ncbi:hypothetical protein WCP94_003780 [Bilophila wadsworthia]